MAALWSLPHVFCACVQVCFMVGFAPGSIQPVVTEKGLKPQVSTALCVVDCDVHH